MIKMLILCMAGATPVSATAQTIGMGVDMNSPKYSIYQSSLESVHGLGLSETPSMQARKLGRARALTVEAEILLKQDGGNFTPEHNAYFRRKACDILGYDRTEIGSLVPRRWCG